MQRFEVKLASDSVDEKTGVFSGYGAVFGNIDSYGDVIEKGAFKDTLREWEQRGKLPPMLLQHGGGMFGGTAEDLLPIGKWLTMEENSKGLKVEGQLFALSTARGQYLYEGLKSGVLDGLSIGFRVKKYTRGTKPTEPARRLEAIDLMELSVVTFPANGKARVTGVKSFRDLSQDEIREIEATFRTKGLSRADAVKAVSGLKEWLRDAAYPVTDLRDEGAAELADKLRRNAAILTS